MHDMKTNQETIHAANLMPVDYQSQQILQQRSLALSSNDKKETTIQNGIHYIRFILGNKEYYGISYAYIKEIINFAQPTPVPHVKNYIGGVINRRGNLICVIDLNEFFNLKIDSENDSKNNYFNIIITDIHGFLIGIITDNIVGSDIYNPDHLNLTQNYDGLIDVKYIIGLDKGNTSILNLDTIFQKIQQEYAL